MSGFQVVVAALLLLMSTRPALAGETSRDFQVGADHFAELVLDQRRGPPVKFYISRTTKPRPLVLYIQGSGCTPAFIAMGGGNLGSTIFSLTTTAHRGDYAVMVVDKPFTPQKFGDGTAVNCPQTFNDFFSADAWLGQVRTAYRRARKLSWIDQRRSLVLGISEGATIATALAAEEPSITNVALVGATGPSQIFDFLAKAHASGGDADQLDEIKSVEDKLASIRSKPDSTTDFAWGHTYKRWSSFFRFSSTQALGRSQARVYLASGMADQSVPVLSTEVLYSELLAQGRDVTFRRVSGAGHGLVPDDGDFAGHMPALEAEFARVMTWFDKGKPLR